MGTVQYLELPVEGADVTPAEKPVINLINRFRSVAL
jgi:hypothetical protein